MKNLRSVLFALTILFMATAAQAQQSAVKANVPFDFIIGNRVYPAGEYVLKSTFNDRALLRIDNTQQVLTGYIVSNACANSAPAKETKLVFHRMGNHYFLYQVWTAGNSTGHEFPRGRAEIELAQNHEQPELVMVAAVISR